MNLLTNLVPLVGTDRFGNSYPAGSDLLKYTGAANVDVGAVINDDAKTVIITAETNPIYIRFGTAATVADGIPVVAGEPYILLNSPAAIKKLNVFPSTGTAKIAVFK